MPPDTIVTDGPVISVIVPVYHDAAGLRVTIDSLVRQSYPRTHFEVIIVDNGSSDETPAVAASLQAANSDLVRFVQETAARGSYAARNEGIRLARGTILCFIDADMTVPAGYLAAVEAGMADGADYLGCRVELYADERTRAADYNRAFGFPVERYVREHHYAPTCCLTVRRSVIERLGGFDARLESGGDVEFGQRVHAAGFRQEYRHDITLHHPARASLRALLLKSRRVARGLAQLRHHYPERYARVGARFLSWRAWMPLKPQHVREQHQAIGVPITAAGALATSLWALPLRWAGPLAYVAESVRLRRHSGRVDPPAARARRTTSA